MSFLDRQGLGQPTASEAKATFRVSPLMISAYRRPTLFFFANSQLREASGQEIESIRGRLATGNLTHVGIWDEKKAIPLTSDVAGS